MSKVLILTETEQKQVVTAYKAKLYTQKELADAYGVSVDTIYRVVKNARMSEQAKTVLKLGNITVTDSFKTITKVVEKPVPVWNASSKFLSITVGRDCYNATPETHKNFKEIVAACNDEDFDKALDMINVARAVTRYVDGDIEITGGALFYQGIEIRSGLVTRIIDSMQKGEDFKFYLPFLENLLENPSEKAVYRLFDFLVANDIELTEDGHFIGWKIVRNDYKDCYTGKMDNSPGQIVKMPRSRVNDNDEQTCSTGLHVCSRGYIGHYGSGNSRIVSVKVHPRDVVSIPVDYNDAKMRACQYEVLEDVTERFKEES